VGWLLIVAGIALGITPTGIGAVDVMLGAGAAVVALVFAVDHLGRPKHAHPHDDSSLRWIVAALTAMTMVSGTSWLHGTHDDAVPAQPVVKVLPPRVPPAPHEVVFMPGPPEATPADTTVQLDNMLVEVRVPGIDAKRLVFALGADTFTKLRDCGRLPWVRLTFDFGRDHSRSRLAVLAPINVAGNCYASALHISDTPDEPPRARVELLVKTGLPPFYR
jgi:4-amino-4-deoxy-L-arabinose transferase-like glycosyltransferase